MVYSGLVPRSPNTTPIAPSTSTRSAVLLSVVCSGGVRTVSLSNSALGRSLVACSFIALSSERRAQRLADDRFGIVAVFGGSLHQARRFHRLVAKLLKRGDGFLLRRRRL